MVPAHRQGVVGKEPAKRATNKLFTMAEAPEWTGEAWP
jgi:hypothetical protein